MQQSLSGEKCSGWWISKIDQVIREIIFLEERIKTTTFPRVDQALRLGDGFAPRQRVAPLVGAAGCSSRGGFGGRRSGAGESMGRPLDSFPRQGRLYMKKILIPLP